MNSHTFLCSRTLAETIYRERRVYFASTKLFFFYVHGSVHRESNLITVQQDATYSVYYISVGSSTCSGC